MSLNVEKVPLTNARYEAADGSLVDDYYLNPSEFSIDGNLGRDGTDNAAHPSERLPKPTILSKKFFALYIKMKTKTKL